MRGEVGRAAHTVCEDGDAHTAGCGLVELGLDRPYERDAVLVQWQQKSSACAAFSIASIYCSFESLTVQVQHYPIVPPLT